MTRKAKRFYAVAIGREPGVYTDWPEAQKQVEGFPGARHKGFMIYSDAEEFLEYEQNKEEERKSGLAR